MELFNTGQSQPAISRTLGMGRKTIRRWLRRGEFPKRWPAHRAPPKVNDFADYLQQRWNAGCHNVSRLYREIHERGYAGKRSMVAKVVAGWRTSGKPKSAKAPERIAPKHAAILVTCAADKVTTEQQKLLDRIMVQCPDVYDQRNIALAFCAALNADNAGLLREWIHKAKRCEFGAVVCFAYGPQKDISAVNAAVATNWSTGQVEGQINRLKMIKRQMYGRAGFTLLRARVLPYTRALPSGEVPLLAPKLRKSPVQNTGITTSMMKGYAENAVCSRCKTYTQQQIIDRGIPECDCGFRFALKDTERIQHGKTIRPRRKWL